MGQMECDLQNPFQPIKSVSPVLPSRYGTPYGSLYVLLTSNILHRKSYLKTKRRSGIGGTEHSTHF